MAKKLKVVKPNGEQHFVPLAAKAQLEAQNNLLPEAQKWTITEVDEAEARGHSFIAKDHVSPSDATRVIKEQTDRIKRLEAELAVQRAQAKANAEKVIKPEAPQTQEPANTQVPAPETKANVKPYSQWNKAELTAEIEKRRTAGRTINTDEARTNPDLVKLLKADDDAAATQV